MEIRRKAKKKWCWEEVEGGYLGEGIRPGRAETSSPIGRSTCGHFPGWRKKEVPTLVD